MNKRTEERIEEWCVVIATALGVCAVIMLGYRAHKNDAKLKAECEAIGGIFVEARQPLHVCIKQLQKS